MYGNNEDGGNGLDFTAGDENQNLEVQEIARCVPSMSVPSLNVKCVLPIGFSILSTSFSLNFANSF